MKSYRQYCALARALDVVGDRWTLLVVRELAVGPRRYGELLDGLPGIATNLLADRLRSLERGGVVTRAGDRYRLTDRGRALEPVLDELLRWGIPLMVTGRGDDEFRAHWLHGAVRTVLRDVRLERPVVVEVHVPGGGVRVEATADGVRTGDPGVGAPPDTTLRGPPDAVLAVLAGFAALDERADVEVAGSLAALRRLLRARGRPGSSATAEAEPAGPPNRA